MYYEPMVYMGSPTQVQIPLWIKIPSVSPLELWIKIPKI
jgi:hypothetical protein